MRVWYFIFFSFFFGLLCEYLARAEDYKLKLNVELYFVFYGIKAKLK